MIPAPERQHCTISNTSNAKAKAAWHPHDAYRGDFRVHVEQLRGCTVELAGAYIEGHCTPAVLSMVPYQ